MAAVVPGLEVDFGHSVGKALGQRFLDAEESDFLWDARVGERWLGAFEGLGDDEKKLDRMAICGRLGGHWFMAIMLVDGEGTPAGTIAHRVCGSRKSARRAMADAR